MKLNDVIEEIKNYRNFSIHKSSLDVFNLLNNNKSLFIDKISSDNLNHLLSKFESLSYASPNEYNTSGYEREYNSNYDLLLFYLNRII